jgi:AcrR family transcriptional regulator
MAIHDGSAKIKIDYSQEVPARILAAAETLIRRDGVRAVSFERIAEAAGVTRGAIYYNFKGRDDLFLSLLERLMDRRILVLNEMLGKTEPSGRVNVVAVGLVEDMLQWRSWTALFLETWLDALGSTTLMERLSKLRERFYAQVSGVLRQAFPQAASQETDEFAIILMGLTAGLAVETSISGRSLNATQLERFLIQALRTHFRDSSQKV